MDLGALWYYSHARWFRWNDDSAYGKATEYAAASESGPQYRWHVRITYGDVKRHDGQRYYTRMKIVGGDPEVQHLKYVTAPKGQPSGWFQY
jgi:hypothetical protein